MMPTPHWWGLRKKFRASIPREVSNNYLASTLGMSEKSAAGNIMPSLRSTGIIDKENKPTNLAVRWRDDLQYPAVCDEIRREVYPQELLDLAPDTSVPRQVMQTWFANHTGAGESGATKMATFYLMLLEADPNKQLDVPQATATQKQAGSPKRAVAAKVVAKKVEAPAGTVVGPELPRGKSKLPGLNINVQIHIAAEAGSEQIDQIFASMAKHLKDFA